MGYAESSRRTLGPRGGTAGLWCLLIICVRHRLLLPPFASLYCSRTDPYHAPPRRSLICTLPNLSNVATFRSPPPCVLPARPGLPANLCTHSLTRTCARAPAPLVRCACEDPGGRERVAGCAVHEGHTRAAPVRVLACGGTGARHARRWTGKDANVQRARGRRAANGHQGVLVSHFISCRPVMCTGREPFQPWRSLSHFISII